jgi:hypothetical protein
MQSMKFLVMYFSAVNIFSLNKPYESVEEIYKQQTSCQREYRCAYWN